MQQYIGTKVIKAKPMTLGEYRGYRKWAIGENEIESTLGYLVEYTDGDESNHPDHEGYISWSPADVFERAYRQTDGLNFGLALEALKKGCLVSHKNWPTFNFLVYVGGTKLINLAEGTPYHRALKTIHSGALLPSPDILPHIDKYVHAEEEFQPGWSPSPEELLSDGFFILFSDVTPEKQ